VSLTRYVKANPDTRVVSVGRAPGEAEIAGWQSGRYLLAVYPDQAALAAVKTRHPFVLPITQARLDATTAAPHTIFTSEDHSWRHVNAALAAEIDAHNARTIAAARAAGQPIATEKLIAFKYDTALAQLLGRVLPQGMGLVGFVLAALLGAVVSSLAAMLNAASTIFAMDIYKKHLAPGAEQKRIVLLGRGSVVAFTLVAVLLAPQLGNPAISNSIFTIIQAGQGFISPGILAVFVFGLLIRRAPPICGIVGLLTNVVVYGFLFIFTRVQFLNAMAWSFFLCLAVMAVITALKPLPQPFVFRHNTTIALETSRSAKLAGWSVVGLALLLYVIFSPLGVAK
jgi:solute:Na+ symporter, SSS family